MLYIPNDSTDPFFNLALEEYLLTQRTDLGDILLLWQNEPTVVIGRNQNSATEVNRAFMQERHIHLARRLSGGGAVYHDLGNLNFTFITEAVSSGGHSFEQFTAPIIRILQSLGISAENTGRNDITIQGKKFSGNAQCHFANRILHHGTILLNSNFGDMIQVLNVDSSKLSSKGISSVRSRVTNICDYLPEPISPAQFKQILLNDFSQTQLEFAYYKLQPDELIAVNKLRQGKYITWDWIYGKTPAFDLSRQQRFSWGQLEAKLSINNGVISDMRFYGDFFDIRNIDELADYLIGSRYDYQILAAKLENISLEEFIPELERGQLLSLLFA